MTRETWRTWILVGVVAVLGAGAIAEQARERRRAPKPLLRLDLSQVHEIERTCAGCDRLVLLKRQGAWELTQPYYAPADARKVAELGAIASAPVRQRFAPGTRDPAAIGLAPPSATLKLGTRTLEFGAAVPPHQDRYVRAGEVLGLVQDRFSAMLSGPPEGFVDPRFLAGVTVVSGSMLGQPIGADALERWREVAAVRVERLPPTFPGHTIEFGLANGKTLVVQFDFHGDELALFRRDVRALYVLGAADVATLGIGR
ncbi:MAG TPA: DUF4340 domain-containing protein [Candidatus Saccharimonadia bacterium]|nr:DUF4340 domain-containing protein [Candidatus Saccharimonadia bacterium]